MLGWNLKPRTPCSSISRRASLTAELALVRVDRGERDQHVRVGRATASTSSLPSRAAAHPGLVVDGEDHGQHRALAVVVGDLLGSRLRRLRRRSSAAAASRISAVTGPAARSWSARRGRARRSRRSRRGRWSVSSQLQLERREVACRTLWRTRRSSPVQASAISSALQPPSRYSTCRLGGMGPEREPVAADADGLAGDVGGGIGGEEHDEPRALLRRAEAVVVADLRAASARRPASASTSGAKTGMRRGHRGRGDRDRPR